ncbi:HAD-IIB family hydrolase [Listeria welshimeri]|uniref:HAD family hydrolase n=1 Tax=Listeria welshimeri TaxID=1643 RepID=UPI0016299A8B|nr:HAD-IIB family hydrolase [Listeria welshimeri]MBC1478208.1 HAD-IIB family hydrolase [Listeria welshimeri]MBC1981025.1 HAD-IIB family hydrolase [Listeria welshimeri]MBF2342112.1 HAD-IIB family hydrolase [Listeria welshimeri]MBF2351651.1 HAD-IIB family hydrolase [Listeria welshimeri]MBF2473391.1 HAD-IIB family hydrolase [Listeria welshimeri]
MKSALFVTDLDGTLVRKNNEIELADLLAIKYWKQSGNLWVVATGRKWGSVEQLLKKYDLSADALILENGALILDASKEIIWQKNIQSETVNQIRNIDLSVVKKVCLVTSYSQTTPQRLLEWTSFKQFSDHTISAIALQYDTADIAKQNIDKVKLALNDVVFRNMNYIDIAPKCCSKGNAIQFLVDKWALNNSKIAVIGDSFNDISMFEVSSQAFTLEHAEKAMHNQDALVVKNVQEAINMVRMEWFF